MFIIIGSKSNNYGGLYMKNVEIYTGDYCPYCMKAKQLLEKEKVAFTEINIGRDDEKRIELEKLSKIRTIPQIFVDGKFIGGCDDIYALHRSGEFDGIFK
jgi:glutaredoxin 3